MSIVHEYLSDYSDEEVITIVAALKSGMDQQDAVRIFGIPSTVVASALQLLDLAEDEIPIALDADRVDREWERKKLIHRQTFAASDDHGGKLNQANSSNNEDNRGKHHLVRRIRVLQVALQVVNECIGNMKEPFDIESPIIQGRGTKKHLVAKKISDYIFENEERWPNLKMKPGEVLKTIRKALNENFLNDESDD